jgi:hypothetical protein
MFPKFAYVALAGLISLASSAPSAFPKDIDCGQPSRWKTEEDYIKWLEEQLRKVEPKQDPSKMYSSADTVQQAIERKLFDTGVIQVVAERQFLGKSAEEADKILRNSGFRRSFVGEERYASPCRLWERVP